MILSRGLKEQVVCQINLRVRNFHTERENIVEFIVFESEKISNTFLLLFMNLLTSSIAHRSTTVFDWIPFREPNS